MLKISIPTPCHEDWEAMIPNEKGRHCNSCIKTVVDFTNMSDEEVKYFFLNKKEDKVCGRFRNDQLQRITIELPKNIFYAPLPFWKKFLAACLIVFSATLFSCETRVNGDAVKTTHDSTSLTTTQFNIGEPSLPPPPPISTYVGDIRVKIVEETTTTGIIIVEKPKEILVIDSNINKVNTDSLPTKNPPRADSIDCDKEIFY
jgi:hypothetical protein